jgi:hypothetical protein
VKAAACEDAAAFTCPKISWKRVHQNRQRSIPSRKRKNVLVPAVLSTNLTDATRTDYILLGSLSFGAVLLRVQMMQMRFFHTAFAATWILSELTVLKTAAFDF